MKIARLVTDVFLSIIAAALIAIAAILADIAKDEPVVEPEHNITYTYSTYIDCDRREWTVMTDGSEDHWSEETTSINEGTVIVSTTTNYGLIYNKTIIGDEYIENGKTYRLEYNTTSTLQILN